MSDINYDISLLLNQAFGLGDNVIKSTVLGPKFKGLKIAEDIAEVHRQSYLGTPIIYPITFKGQKYQYYTDTGELDTVQLEDFELPAVALSTFSRKKNLSQTKLAAGYGTVKEMYGFDDWRIEIRGLCLKDPSHPIAKSAYEQHLKLVAFEKVAEAIPVVSELFNDKGIDSLVILSAWFGQIKGKPGVIPFRLQCLSDTPTELIL